MLLRLRTAEKKKDQLELYDGRLRGWQACAKQNQAELSLEELHYVLRVCSIQVCRMRLEHSLAFTSRVEITGSHLENELH